jgi:hypothetical protein
VSPLDQLHAQFFLQLLDLGGERGLADEAGIGCVTEMALLIQRDEIAQGAEVHVS